MDIDKSYYLLQDYDNFNIDMFEVYGWNIVIYVWFETERFM